jgi:hypothetical protein
VKLETPVIDLPDMQSGTRIAKDDEDAINAMEQLERSMKKDAAR